MAIWRIDYTVILFEFWLVVHAETLFMQLLFKNCVKEEWKD